MTEQHREDHVQQPGPAPVGPDEGDAAATASRSTAGEISSGSSEVDAVLSSLEGLAELPVDEHVAVFERAHESLRRTLNDAGQQADRD